MASVRDATRDLLRSLGLTTVFGNPGSTELPFLSDFPSDFRYVLGLQESVAVGMADGYAQATRAAAFVNLHSAAGVGHAMGAIFTAYRNHTPLVITAGQQARAILPNDPFLFSADAAQLPKPYVKWSCEPARAQDVPLAIARGYYTAMQPPRGPALISVPVDDWPVECGQCPTRVVSTEMRAQQTLLNEVAVALDRSRRPAFVVGDAVDRDGAWDAVVQLAERHSAAVWTAPMAGRRGFPENHRLFAGFLPAIREKIVDALRGHDLIVVLGAAAFTYHVEGSGPHGPDGARVLQLIDDPTMAASSTASTSVLTSMREGISELLARPAAAERALPAARRAPPVAAPSTPMTTAYVMQTLACLRDAASIVVEEAPSARPVIQDYLPITRSETFYTMCSGGLGYGLPAAIGIALGKPHTKVIALVGDGSAMYSIQALWNAIQLNLPITFLILRNRRYAAVYEFAPKLGFGTNDVIVGTDLPDLDFVLLAQGQGCDAARVANPDLLEAALRRALASARPALLEIAVA